MRHELLMPKLGLTMTEGIISEWMVQAGQAFKNGDLIFVVETDKIANEIPADHDGTLLNIVVPAGETVPVGTVLGYWTDGQPDDLAIASDKPTTSTHNTNIAQAATNTLASTTPSGQGHTPAQPATAQRIVASPLARRLAKQYGIALEQIAGSGPKGRIVARNINAKAADASKTQDTLQHGATHPSPYQLITPTALQTTIARRLTEGKQQTPHFYLALEAEVSRLLNLRAEINQAQSGIRLTLNHFIVMAVAHALALMPQANRVWTADGILAFERIDVGVAVNTEQGLLAPAVCDVGGQSIRELARSLDAVAERARNGSLTSPDMGNPAITVSNAGMHNVTYMSSIINPGQAMILGVGSIKGIFRPDDAGQPVLRQEMGLVLSADHRIIDGVGALKFLNIVVQLLEQPTQLLVN